MPVLTLYILMLALSQASPVEIYQVRTILCGQAKDERQADKPVTCALDGITSVAAGEGTELFVAGNSLQIVDLREGSVKRIPETDDNDWSGLAMDRFGNLYSFDERNRIVQVHVSGKSRVLATPSVDEGNPNSDLKMFQGGGDLVVHKDGNVFVADDANNRIRKVLPDGAVTTVAGSGLDLKQADVLTSACLTLSSGESLSKDHVNLLDWPEHELRHEIREVFEECRHIDRELPHTEFVRAVANATSKVTHKDGLAHEARFYGLMDIALDDDGNLLVVDAWNRRVRRISPEGVVTTLAGSTYGFRDGPGREALFAFPRAITTNDNGNIYVIDNVTIRKIDRGGFVTTIATEGESQAEAAEDFNIVRFNLPTDITVDDLGNLYVAENGSQALRKLTKEVPD